MFISVTSKQIADFQGSNVTEAVLKIFSNKNWTDSDAVDHVKGRKDSENFYQSIPCAIDTDGTITIPDTYLQTTTDALRGNNVKLSAYLYVAIDGEVQNAMGFLKDFRIPTTLGNTNWDLIGIENEAPAVALPDAYYTTGQTDTLFANLVNMAYRATTAVFGASKSSKTPIVSGSPEHVETSENLFLDGKKRILYADKTGTFAQRVTGAAVQAAGALKRFILSESVSVAASTTIGANLQLTRDGDGLISVASGQTLVVGNMFDHGSVQFFDDTAAGTYNVNCDEFDLAWIKPAGNVDISAAFTKARASLVARTTSKISVPNGSFPMATQPVIPNNSHIDGKGMSYGASGYGTRFTNTSNGELFKVGGLSRNVKFSNFEIDNSNVLNATGILCEAASPDSTFLVDVEKVSILNGDYGFRVNSLTGQWQIEQIRLTDFVCLGVDVGVSIDTGNSSLTVENAYFSLPENGTAFQIQGVGLLKIGGGTTAVSGGNNNTTFMQVTGEHLGIQICVQNEGVNTFLQVDVGFISKGILIHDSLVQSAIRLNESAMLQIERTNLPAESIYDSPTSASRITMKNCSLSPHPANPLELAKTLRLSNGIYESVSMKAKVNTTFTVNAATDIATFPASVMRTGCRVTLASTTTLPAGLSAGTNYWLAQVNPLDTAPTQFYFCISLADATNRTGDGSIGNPYVAAPIKVNMTSVGTGTHTATLPAGRFGNNLTVAILDEYDRHTYESWIQSHVLLVDTPIALRGNPTKPRFGIIDGEANKVMFQLAVAGTNPEEIAVDGFGNQIAYNFGINSSDRVLEITGKQTGFHGIRYNGGVTITGNFGAANIAASGILSGNAIVSSTSISGGAISGSSISASKRIIAGVSNLVDAATITTDASLADTFRVVLTDAVGATRILGAPANPIDNQVATWEFLQGGTGSKNITFDAVFVFGTSPTAPTLTATVGKRDMLRARYNSAAAKWFVTSVNQNL